MKQQLHKCLMFFQHRMLMAKTNMCFFLGLPTLLRHLRSSSSLHTPGHALPLEAKAPMRRFPTAPAAPITSTDIGLGSLSGAVEGDRETSSFAMLKMMCSMFCE